MVSDCLLFRVGIWGINNIKGTEGGKAIGIRYWVPAVSVSLLILWFETE